MKPSFNLDPERPTTKAHLPPHTTPKISTLKSFNLNVSEKQLKTNFKPKKGFRTSPSLIYLSTPLGY